LGCLYVTWSFSVDDLRVDVPVGDKKVFPAIVVEVEKADAETKVFPVNT